MEKIRADELLKKGQAVEFMPQGYSMYPTIVPGRDSVVVAPLNGRRLKRGDVALFRRNPEQMNGMTGNITDEQRKNGMLVIHRVWRCKKDGIYMVGDNESLVEGPLAPEQFCGIMTELHRKGKRIGRNNIIYRFLEGIWLFLRPVRPQLSGFAAKIKKAKKGA